MAKARKKGTRPSDCFPGNFCQVSGTVCPKQERRQGKRCRQETLYTGNFIPKFAGMKIDAAVCPCRSNDFESPNYTIKTGQARRAVAIRSGNACTILFQPQHHTQAIRSHILSG